MLHAAFQITVFKPFLGIFTLRALRDAQAQQLLGQAEGYLPPHAVAQRQIIGNQPQRGQPAQGVFALDQRNLCACPRGGQRGSHARNAAPGDQHIACIQHGQGG